MIEEIASEVSKRPAWIAVAVIAVALLAYFQSRGNSSQQDVTFAGGGAARGIDPNAAAIEEAAINAGSQNIAAITNLLGMEHSNETALAGTIAETNAAREVALNGSNNALTQGLASIAAGREVSLATISSAQEAQDAATAERLSESATSADAQKTIAKYNADSATAIAASNAATAQAATAAQERTAQTQAQTQKDVARAADNTSIFSGIVNLIPDVLAIFGF